VALVPAAVLRNGRADAGARGIASGCGAARCGRRNVCNVQQHRAAARHNSHVAGQSETVQLLADRIAFRHTRLLGAQDTIFAAGPMAGSRQYFLQSYVNGSCDSIYGTSSMVFEECEIAITDSITAHRGTKFGWNPARGDRSFYYFINSSLVKPEKGGRP